MSSEYQSLSPAESCTSLLIDPSECFICRDVELKPSDPLRKFCDCKNLLAHHSCLSTWIQKGCGSNDRPRCIVCKSKYQVQRSSPWRSVRFWCHTWMVLLPAFAVLTLVPYAIHCLLVTFAEPPPPVTFKMAAVASGVLMEILLLIWLSGFLSRRYQKAKQSSFTVRPRGCEDDGTDPSDRDRPDSAAARLDPSPPSESRAEQKKVEVWRSG